MTPTDAMDTHWVESRPVSQTMRQDCQDFTHKLPDWTTHMSTLPVIKPLRHLTQQPPTPSIQAFCILAGCLIRKHSEMHRPVAKCQGQSAKAGSILHYVEDEVEANKHKVCYTLAVGFVWYLPGPVDASINMACAGLSVGTVGLSQRYKSLALRLHG
jgi:hypothetical protein